VTAPAIEAAAPEPETAATHKEDREDSAPSFGSLAGWKTFIIDWWSGGPRPPLTFLREAERHGVPNPIPLDPKDRVQALSLAGFDEEDVMAAVPDLHPVHVIEIIERVPGDARSIVAAHFAGKTPVQIEEQVGVTRSRVYYWLAKVGQRPNRTHRGELTVRQREQIVRAWRAGEPMASVARRFQVSYDQVRHAVRGAK
jgi:hypothetical protein